MPHCPIHGEVPCPKCSGQKAAISQSKKMTAKQRRERAKRAAAARWKKKR